MRRMIVISLCVLGIAGSVWWLIGYTRAVWPFAEYGIRNGDWSFLATPQIKFYKVFDSDTQEMSGMKVDWFSVFDGPTGVHYNHYYFPSWIVSLAAVGVLGFCVFALFAFRPERPDPRTKASEVK